MRELRKIALIAVLTLGFYGCKAEGPAPLLSYEVPVARPATTIERTSMLGVFRTSTAQFILAVPAGHDIGVAAITFGYPEDIPLLGDWDGDGIPSIGLYRPSDQTFRLRNSNSQGEPDYVIRFGEAGDVPLVGDWNGDGRTTIGVFHPATATFLLRNENTPGPPDIKFTFGIPTDIPIAGDWDGDGITTVGLYRRSMRSFFLRNENTTGFASIGVKYGEGDDTPIAGDWNGSGKDSIGVFRSGVFRLRDSIKPGAGDRAVGFGVPGDKPVSSLHQVSGRAAAINATRPSHNTTSQPPEK